MLYNGVPILWQYGLYGFKREEYKIKRVLTKNQNTQSTLLYSLKRLKAVKIRK